MCVLVVYLHVYLHVDLRVYLHVYLHVSYAEEVDRSESRVS